jgi:hypothetical protein
MTFDEAEKEVKELANGKYFAVQYGRTTYDDNSIKIQCEVYVAGNTWHYAPTWRSAIDELRVEMGALPVATPDISTGIDDDLAKQFMFERQNLEEIINTLEGERDNLLDEVRELEAQHEADQLELSSQYHKGERECDIPV